MMADSRNKFGPASAESAQSAGMASGNSKPGERREIKGGIPYTTSPGVLKRALELIIQAERPDKFSANYMETVLKLTGGGARAVPPLLKKMQFIGSDGAPTGLYSKFKTEGGRSQAAFDGLRNAFSELFKKNEYIYKADEGAVKDAIVEITGLKKNDHIVRLMYASFDAVRGFVSTPVSGAEAGEWSDDQRPSSPDFQQEQGAPSIIKGLGLSYQINIVLPETENVSVFNAIFKSLRDNLLR